MKKKTRCIILFIIFITVFLLTMKSNEIVVTDIQIPTESKEIYIKFQDKMSMDWDSNQGLLLMYNSMYHTGHGGTAEEYAYNILVVLNRMLSDEYPNTIEEVCDCPPLNLSSDEAITETVKRLNSEVIKGMHLVMYDRWDETNGSLEYKHTLEFLK